VTSYQLQIQITTFFEQSSEQFSIFNFQLSIIESDL